MKKFLYAPAALAILFGLSAPASAQDALHPLAKERFQVRIRAIDVVPDVSSSVNIGGGC